MVVEVGPDKQSLRLQQQSSLCARWALFQYSDKTLVFVYFFLFGRSGIMLSSLISTFFTRAKSAMGLCFMMIMGIWIQGLVSKKSRRNFAPSVLSANKKIASAKLSLWSEIAPVIPPASLSVNNICKSIMFACATCRRQLQMKVCATKVRETATFIAGMSRWSTWKVDGDLDLTC
ncbi:uncharacterized protein LOC110920442 isoform X3 [Helianthus annuus]|uniref:uncharacterized protein LOC110920442 isoform X3 n=1 Tax=Helianthus annuus TaxID=4232 RepID=UPI001652DC8D|nr:uncharacterized protein LOC110920442 isoform X3 [Helianthus annuus]